MSHDLTKVYEFSDWTLWIAARVSFWYIFFPSFLFLQSAEFGRLDSNPIFSESAQIYLSALEFLDAP